MSVRFQFDLKRLLVVVTVSAIIAGLFACLQLEIALLTLATIDLIASVLFELYAKSRLSLLLLVSAILIQATLYYTDWGHSRPIPDFRVAWSFLIATFVAHAAVAFVWLIDAA